MIFFKTDATTNKVTFIHYDPFSVKHGLNKTQTELESEGYLVDSIPSPTEQTGKIPALYYTVGSGFWYEYVDAPLTEREEIQSLKEQNAEMLLALVSNGLL